MHGVEARSQTKPPTPTCRPVWPLTSSVSGQQRRRVQLPPCCGTSLTPRRISTEIPSLSRPRSSGTVYLLLHETLTILAHSRPFLRLNFLTATPAPLAIHFTTHADEQINNFGIAQPIVTWLINCRYSRRVSRNRQANIASLSLSLSLSATEATLCTRLYSHQRLRGASRPAVRGAQRDANELLASASRLRTQCNHIISPQITITIIYGSLYRSPFDAVFRVFFYVCPHCVLLFR